MARHEVVGDVAGGRGQHRAPVLAGPAPPHPPGGLVGFAAVRRECGDGGIEGAERNGHAIVEPVQVERESRWTWMFSPTRGVPAGIRWAGAAGPYLRYARVEGILPRDAPAGKLQGDGGAGTRGFVEALGIGRYNMIERPVTVPRSINGPCAHGYGTTQIIRDNHLAGSGASYR